MDIAIGELSRRAQVKIPTVRYYEQIGLLPPPVRSEGKQRRYGAGEVKRLNFIRHARELGFEVDEIRQLLALTAEPQESCHEVDSIARHHLEDIDRRINQLTMLREELTRMIDECGHGRVCDCRIVEIIADHSKCLRDHCEQPNAISAAD
jgi:DNA-binding transcriptional MerR regulator